MSLVSSLAKRKISNTHMLKKKKQLICNNTVTNKYYLLVQCFRCSLEGEQSSMLYDVSDQRDEVS